MRKTLRTALIWMLMLALPAQAMAALGMQLCEQVHRSGALQISGSEHGGHHDMTADSAHGAHQDAAPVASSEVPAAGSLCTLCAFCVGGAAPGQAFLKDSALQTAEPAAVWLDRLIVGVADTPERPPRLSLA
ncbi:hypothetical protein DZC76_12620 [Pseudomonas sp. phDV1]|nr:hypothetical protein [Pseudomonas sp. phDV1]AXO62004.1 hypothetical protein DZC76_12620 [Pseudomonas sp. phDV1]